MFCRTINGFLSVLLDTLSQLSGLYLCVLAVNEKLFLQFLYITPFMSEKLFNTTLLTYKCVSSYFNLAGNRVCYMFIVTFYLTYKVVFCPLTFWWSFLYSLTEESILEFSYPTFSSLSVYPNVVKSSKMCLFPCKFSHFYVECLTLFYTRLLCRLFNDYRFYILFELFVELLFFYRVNI